MNHNETAAQSAPVAIPWWTDLAEAWHTPAQHSDPCTWTSGRRADGGTADSGEGASTLLHRHRERHPCS
jgi:hypothetical protein